MTIAPLPFVYAGLYVRARHLCGPQGAEIEGLVKSACSYALDRKVNLDQVQAGKRATAAEMNDVMVTKMDFDRALDEVRPAFGR